jgi:cytochrome P450
MLVDPDLVPFTPPERMTLRALRNNFVEAFPRSTFDQPITRVRAPFNDILLICDPDVIHEMLVDKADRVGRSAIMTRVFAPFVGHDSVFVTQGPDWLWKRRALTPLFGHDRLSWFAEAFAAVAARQVERWQSTPTDAPVDIAAAMRRTTFAIIVNTILNDAVDLDADGYGQALTDAFEIAPWALLLALASAPEWTPFPGKRQLVRAREYVYREVGRIVARRSRVPRERQDLLDTLIAARDPATGRGMTESEIVNNVITFISTGHEVSAQALTWTLWLVAKDPVTHQRIADEVRAVAGDGPITLNQVQALAFTEQVLQEGMRLFPPATVLLRQASADMTLGGMRVKAGTHLQIPIYSLHRHVRLWDNPNAFDPERFAPDRLASRSRYAYIPFGAGPRVCIGANFAMMEMTVVLATLVRAFRFRPVPGHKPKPIARISLRVNGGMPLFIEPAHSAASAGVAALS